MSGVMSGMVNQKVDPTAGLDAAPMRPPRTATCLLQMLRPRPVPPACRGRRISSSVPCSTPRCMSLCCSARLKAEEEGTFAERLLA